MKTLLTKCLATVKGWFSSPAHASSDLQFKLDEAEVEINHLHRQLRNASKNESLLAARIGKFQTAHPELHAEFFTSKRKG